MAKELKDIPTFTRQFWKGLGDEVADRIRVHTTKDGKDVEGRKFRAYSTQYKNRKASGKFRRQSSRSSKVDLQLTGDMMRNLQTRGFSKDNVIIGWSGVNASKVEWNAQMKNRVITSNVRPVSKGIERFILSEVSRFIRKNAKEATKKPINIKIGK
jgi:hypothetical protein